MKIKSEIKYLRPIFSFDQNTIIKNLDKIIVNQECFFKVFHVPIMSYFLLAGAYDS